MFVVWSQRPQRLFMMAEVIQVFAKKVADEAETLKCMRLEIKMILSYADKNILETLIINCFLNATQGLKQRTRFFTTDHQRATSRM